MTLEEANRIWNDCYGNTNDLSLWNNYTTEQRLQAIEVRSNGSDGGTWGIWNISDRD